MKGGPQKRVANVRFIKAKSVNRVDGSFTTYQTILEAQRCDVVRAYKMIWILSKGLLTSVSRPTEPKSLENNMLFAPVEISVPE